jgi:hypothetical protein
MRKLAVIVLGFAFMGAVAPASAQKAAAPKQSAGARLEALLNAAEIPFNKPEEGRYVAVISLARNESEKFHIYLNYVGDNPNEERLQFYQMYFLLGQIPKGESFPPALIKQINEWNTNLTLGRVIATGGVVMYTTTGWLSRADAESLAQDAVIGHYASEDLRKSVAPYLKQ